MLRLGKRLKRKLPAGLTLALMMGIGSAGTVLAREDLEISVVGGNEDTMVLNTATCGTLNGLSALRHLYEGLYKLGEDEQPVLGQAKEVTTSEDLMTWTFTLREDITWSDGEPVRAQDFIYGWDYLRDMANDYSTILSDIVASYEAPDDKTLVLQMEYPCVYLPAVLAFPSTAPAREDYVTTYGDAYGTDPEKSAYNGPFALTEWVHGSSVVMERREDYYDAQQIDVERINWDLIGDERTALFSFESGDLAFSALCPDEEKPRMEGQGLFYAPGNNDYCVMFNLGENGDDCLKDPDVRRALSLAIDRERIIDIREMNDEAGITFACSGYLNEDGVDFTEYADPWLDPGEYQENCALARELLAKAGYENGVGFPHLSYIVNSDSRKEIAEAVVGDWTDALGIDSIVVEMPENFFAARNDGDYDLAYYGWLMDYTDLSNMFGAMANTADRDCFYDNPEYLQEYRMAVSTADEKEQWEHYKNCEAILAEDLPVAVILHSMNSYLFDELSYDGLVYSCGNFVFTYLHTR